MATLIIGVVVLAGGAACASLLSEGAWLTFFESPAQPEHMWVEAQSQSNGVCRLANPPGAKHLVESIPDVSSRQVLQSRVYT